jgi:hypothetical protein
MWFAVEVGPSSCWQVWREEEFRQDVTDLLERMLSARFFWDDLMVVIEARTRDVEVRLQKVGNRHWESATIKDRDGMMLAMAVVGNREVMPEFLDWLIDHYDLPRKARESPG